MEWGWRHIDGTISWGISPYGDLVELRTNRHEYTVHVMVPSPEPDLEDTHIEYPAMAAKTAVRLFYTYLQFPRPWYPLTIKHVTDNDMM